MQPTWAIGACSPALLLCTPPIYAGHTHAQRIVRLFCTIAPKSVGRMLSALSSIPGLGGVLARYAEQSRRRNTMGTP